MESPQSAAVLAGCMPAPAAQLRVHPHMYLTKNYMYWTQQATTSVIPTVEVEPPGCSFNPPLETHQVCVNIYLGVPDMGNVLYSELLKIATNRYSYIFQ